MDDYTVDPSNTAPTIDIVDQAGDPALHTVADGLYWCREGNGVRLVRAVGGEVTDRIVINGKQLGQLIEYIAKTSPRPLDPINLGEASEGM